nr:ATPase, F1/V1/A1 complex, alpha/beta subunit, zinc knuckle CX2CX4HX4C [Tanacetum cinerariifolium]
VIVESGVTCDGSPKVSYSSPLVYLSTNINIPRRLDNIDVAATFKVSLTTVGDLHKLLNDTEAGKHDELLSEMTNDDRKETMDALGTLCNSIQDDNTNADVIPCKVSHMDDSTNVDESTIPSDPIVRSLDINTKSTSYVGAAGASEKDQPKVSSNFCTLVADPVFDGVNIFFPRKVVKKFVGLYVKQDVRYERKATTSALKKEVTNVVNTSQSASMLKTTGNSLKKDNLSISNSFYALNDEEDVENVYDESAHLIHNTKLVEVHLSRLLLVSLFN